MNGVVLITLMKFYFFAEARMTLGIENSPLLYFTKMRREIACGHFLKQFPT